MRRRGIAVVRVFVLVLVLVLVIGALGACSGDDDTDGDASAPTDAIAAGEEAYATYCAQCHGADLRGTATGPSFLSIVYEPNHHPDEAFRRAPRDGVVSHHWNFGDMAPVPAVTDAELEAIIAFVRDAQEREGFEEYPPPELDPS
ncbi:MAG TPA: cytochrome c [Acidimicrobiia bacterium]|nr:cytochrome c [Acidimicrobiia bacterium]